MPEFSPAPRWPRRPRSPLRSNPCRKIYRRREAKAVNLAALKLRRSTREYSDRPLPAQVLSDLLWAAFGVNRPAIDGRTVPYWRHIMVIDVYLAMADGVWLYEPKSHRL